jgi:hypothetical protein
MEAIMNPILHNNMGAQYLRAGRFEEANNNFKLAAEMTSRIIKQGMQSKLSSNENFTRFQCDQGTTILNVTPQLQFDIYEDNRTTKRRKIVNEIPTFISRWGCPLTIKSFADGHQAVNAVSLSAILLYNLALSYNLKALIDSEHVNFMYLQRSLGFYKRAFNILFRRPFSQNSNLPIIAFILHNTSLIYQYLEIPDLESKHSEMLIQILREMANRELISGKRYELFYLKMLFMHAPVASAA